jgi:hypothetical protein
VEYTRAGAILREDNERSALKVEVLDMHDAHVKAAIVQPKR